MRVADFIIDYLYNKYEIKYISLITGNGALVINDAICKNKKITPICVHHEQDAGFIAVGYSKYTNKLSVVNPTTGCASTNCITSLLSAYQDYVPVLFLSGNVSFQQTIRYIKKTQNIKIRKLGSQETDIIEIVQPLTKYATVINDVNMIQYELDKAINIATSHPMGPVWIDLPANTGASIIDENKLIKYHQNNEIIPEIQYQQKIKKVLLKLKKYTKPLILAGHGISLSNSRIEFKKFIEKYEIPVVTTFGGVDLLEYDHSLYLGGQIGIKGCRASNFVIQQSDFLLILGACLNIPQVGYIYKKFAPKAYNKVVDILNKNLKKDSVIVWDAGSCAYVVSQNIRFGNNQQRNIGAFAQGGMGCAIPLSVGVSFGKNQAEVICCVGDGSFHANVQSLAVIKKHSLPIKLLVWNNNGYMSIKNSQDKFYEGRRMGTCSSDGIFFPKIKDIARAYQIKYFYVDKIKNFDIIINKIFNINQSIILEIKCKEIQDILPNITAFKNKNGIMEQYDFSQMFPFLDCKEYNKLIKKFQC